MAQSNAALTNRMCAVCRQIRPDRYLNCPGGCKAFTAYMACTENTEEAECSKAWHLIGERGTHDGQSTKPK